LENALSSTNECSRRPKFRGAVVALTLLSGAIMSSAVSLIDAPSSAATPPFPCKQSPDGKSCTQGDDGAGGGSSISMQFQLDSSMYSIDYYVRIDGKDTTNAQATALQNALGYPVCYRKLDNKKVVECVDL
jgi:hypothetical protein